MILSVGFVVLTGCDTTSSQTDPQAKPDTSPPIETAPESKWYEGGTLHKGSGLDWVKADQANKLATAADLLASLWMKKALAPKLSSKIGSIDDLKGSANELVVGLDKSFEGDLTNEDFVATLKNQTVTESSVILMTMMGWL